MSPRRTNLSHPGVIVGVLAMLAVIIVVNVRTFGPQRAGAQRADAVRVQAHPAIPLDLEEVLQQSGRAAGHLGVQRTGPRPDLLRDPFVAGSSTPARSPDAEPKSRSVARTTAAARGGALACTAVMLGGGAPAALIDGRLCRVGDRVRQFSVERIDARGVTLGGESRQFLPVGVISTGADANVVVTGAAPGDRHGGTSLVEYVEGERK
jgi:hypothetical protein